MVCLYKMTVDVRAMGAAEKHLLFLRINLTEKNFCHTVNRTQDLGTNRLAYDMIYLPVTHLAILTSV